MDDVKPITSVGDSEIEVSDDPEVEGEFTPKLGADGKPLPYNQDPRWKKVYSGFKKSREYAALGTPEELSAKMQKLAYYEGLLNEIEEEKKEAKPGTKDEADAEARMEAIRAEILKLFPKLAKLDDIDASIGLMYDSLKARAEDEVTKVCKEFGITGGMEKGSPRQAFASVLADLIDNTPELLYEYMTNPRAAVREAVKIYQKMFKGNVSTDPVKKSQADLMRSKLSHAALPKGGTPSGGSGVQDNLPAPARSVKAATANVKERLRALREQDRV
jgi:hypothetical protein